jgi:hypothetical protein
MNCSIKNLFVFTLLTSMDFDTLDVCLAHKLINGTVRK